MPVSGISRPQRLTTTEHAYRSILSAIIDGSIPSGSPLRLQELADTLGMSMMPIREAIRRLESIGVIESVAHRGARVRPVSVQDLEDTYLTRIVHEGALVRLAAPRFDRAAGDECRQALDAQRDALGRGDVEAARRAHERFHYRIYQVADSGWLLRSIAPTWHNSERYRAASTADPETVRIRRTEHEDILDACLARDPDRARRALTVHLLTSVRLLAPRLVEPLRERVLLAQPDRG